MFCIRRGQAIILFIFFTICHVPTSGSQNSCQENFSREALTSCHDHMGYTTTCYKQKEHVLSVLPFRKCRRISTLKSTEYVLVNYMLSNPVLYKTEVSFGSKSRAVIKSRYARKLNRKAFRVNQNNRPKVYFRIATHTEFQHQSRTGTQGQSTGYLNLLNKLMQPKDLLSHLTIQRV